MNDKRSKGVPYGYANTPDSDGSSSKTGMYVIGAVVALVVIVGFVALVMTSESGSGESTIGDAVQEQAAVQVDGEPLPPYPEDGGLFANPASDPAVGMTPPTLTGQSFDGEDITIEPGTGTPMVVVFATHWCGHCQKEIPEIQSWLDDGGLPEGVQLNLVNTAVQADQNNYPPSGWLSGVGWSQPVLLDNPDQAAGNSWGLTGFPYMVFLDADGKVVQRASGELPNEQFDVFVKNLDV